MENSIINKPSAMIQTNVAKLTAVQRKMINYLVFFSQKTGDEKYYYTSLKKIKKACGISTTKNLDLKKQFEALGEISIKFNYLEKDKYRVWKSMNVIAAVSIAENSGEVKFEIPSMLKEIILDPKIYAPLNVLLIAGLKSKYSIVLYELLRDYIDSPKFPKLTIIEFKNLLSVDSKKYKYFSDFKKKVLNIAVNEINEKTDITCSYELIKSDGNKYSHIQFQIEKDIENVVRIISKTSENISVKIDNLANNLSLNGNQKNELKEKIPLEILRNLKIEDQTTNVFNVIISNLNLGEEFILSNLEYVYNQPNVEIFIKYFKTALKENYGSETLEKKIQLEKKENKKKERVEKIKLNIELFNKQKEKFKNYISKKTDDFIGNLNDDEMNFKLEEFKKSAYIGIFLRDFERDGVNSKLINPLFRRFIKDNYLENTDREFLILCKGKNLEVKKINNEFVLSNNF